MNNTQKSGMGRMLSYMGVYAQRIMLFFILFMVAWTAYMTLISGAHIAESIAMIPAYYVGLGSIIGMICTMGYIPLLGNGMLSMGATRKELSLGLIAGHFLIGLEVTVLGIIVHAIFNKALTGDSFLYGALVLGLNLVTTGFGMIIALLVDRFGKVAYYIAVAIIAVSAGVLGGIGATFMFGGDSASLNLALPWNVVALLGGAVVFAIGSLIIYLGFRRKTVVV